MDVGLAHGESPVRRKRETGAVGLLGQLVLGRYRVLHRLGAGGMGVVFLARSEGAAGFFRPVIVKAMHPDFDQEGRGGALFAREARIMSSLRHPSIVGVIDFGQQEHRYVMVLEYVHGYDLGKWFKFLRATRGAFPAEHAVHIAIEVLRALHHAHTQKGPKGESLRVIHRDVTPSNIILDVTGHAKLADFGIARMDTEKTNTANRTIKGKFAYLAPELLADGEPSVASDIYSVGVVLHQLLVGRNEFSSTNAAKTIARVLHHAPTPLRQVRPDVSSGFAAIVAKALSKEPNGRFASAAAMAEALVAERGHTEGAATDALAEAVVRDFRDPNMALRLGIPQLDFLENTWNSPEPSRNFVGVSALTVEQESADPSIEIIEESIVEESIVEESIVEESIVPLTSSISRAVEPPEVLSQELSPRRWYGWSAVLLVVSLVATGFAVAVVLTGQDPGSDRPTYLIVDRQGQGSGEEPVPPRIVQGKPGAEIIPPDAGQTERPRSKEEELARAFAKRSRAVSLCFSRFAATEGELQITVRLSVGRDGKVKQARVLPGSVAKTGLGKCIRDVAGTATFGQQPTELRFVVPLSVKKQ